jgi:hypothetical protein
MAEDQNLVQKKGVGGALATAGFVLLLVAGIVGAVDAFRLVGANGFFDDLLLTFLVILAMAVIAVVGAALAWKGAHELGGAMGIAAAIGFLVAQPEVAGYLAVAGGILLLVANRFEDPAQDRPTA